MHIFLVIMAHTAGPSGFLLLLLPRCWYIHLGKCDQVLAVSLVGVNKIDTNFPGNFRNFHLHKLQ